MKITDHSTMSDITFSTRLRGFDQAEVRAFIANLANEYTRVVRELDQAKQELQALREFPSQRQAAVPDRSVREVEQILASAARIAEEVRQRAEEQGNATVGAATVRAADIVHHAEQRAREIIDDAARQVAHLGERAEAVRLRYVQMRSAFESALDAAASALREIAVDDDEALADASSKKAQPGTSQDSTTPTRS